VAKRCISVYSYRHCECDRGDLVCSETKGMNYWPRQSGKRSLSRDLTRLTVVLCWASFTATQLAADAAC